MSNEWYNRKKDEDNDSKRIVVTAAKLIRLAIREMECDTENYLASDVFASVDGAKQWAPSLLNTLRSC